MTFQSPGHLAWQVRIVDEQGRPTPAFLRFIQQLTGNGASTDTTAKQALDGLADKQPADNDLTALSELAGTGIAVRSATDTWSLRTLQAGTGISITNPAGIAGDPSIACTISQYTDEQAQDAVATMLVAGTNITLTYNDTLNTLAIDAAGGGGSGTVTTTGSPSSGALVKFSGASSITNGDLTGDVTTSGGLATTLAASGVTAGTYGDATHVAQITVDAKGRVTSVSSVAVSGGSGGSASVWDHMWGQTTAVSTGATAFKGLRVISRQTVTIDGISTDLVTPVNGATYVAYIASMSSTTTIGTLLGTSSTFTASGTTRRNPLLFTFSTPVTLTSGSAYALIVGRTDSVGTYVLPIPTTGSFMRYCTAPLQNDGYLGATAAPTNGATVTYSSGLDGFPIGVRWQTS